MYNSKIVCHFAAGKKLMKANFKAINTGVLTHIISKQIELENPGCSRFEALSEQLHSTILFNIYV